MSLSLSSFLPAVDRRLKSMRAACGLRTCQNTQLMRMIPGARQGITVGPVWYCSVDCFAIAAQAPLRALARERVIEIPRSPRFSLGLALLSKGILTAEQLRVAGARSRWLEEELEVTLVKLGMATEKQLASARSMQWGYPVLAPEYIGQMVEADIPRTVMVACGVVPLHYSAAARRILLGFASRVEHRVLESIGQITGARIEPCFITPTDLEEQMKRVTAPPDYEEVVVDDLGSPEKMARTVGRVAVGVGAFAAGFNQCRSMVVARLVGKRGKADVVFHMSSANAERLAENSASREETIAV